MGQRSEIFVFYEQNGKKHVVARYFGWNYAERMVSRVTYTAKWLKNRINLSFNKADLVSIIETNFDIVDHLKSSDIINHYNGRDAVSVLPDGMLNDGRGFIFVSEKGDVKYCFTDNDSLEPLDANAYMIFDTSCCYNKYKWTNREYRFSAQMKKCRDNIRWLKKNASLLTRDELNTLIKGVYE